MREVKELEKPMNHMLYVVNMKFMQVARHYVQKVWLRTFKLLSYIHAYYTNLKYYQWVVF